MLVLRRDLACGVRERPGRRLVRSADRGPVNSTHQVLLPGIVDEADLTEGNAKLMGSQAIAQIGGPRLGGMLAQAAGPVGELLADAISFGASFCCLIALQAPRDRRSGAPAAGGMLDGLRFAWRDPYLRAMRTAPERVAVHANMPLSESVSQ
jgi:hypothetical protein